MIELTDRFWSKVEKTDTCWVWWGSRHPRGYGHFWWINRMVVAHRLSYMATKGDIPQGYEIDHLCRNTSCVNPNHLEAVTHKENVIRGEVPFVSARRAEGRTHCPMGHEFTTENTYYRPKGGRECRACMRIRDRIRSPRNPKKVNSNV